MKIVGTIGNEELWCWRKTLFLCSKQTPYGYYANIFAWVEGLTEEDCVVCCDTTELEREVFTSLLVNRIPTILVITNRFKNVNNIQVDRALKERRLMILILNREPEDRGMTSGLRNHFLMTHAEKVVAGYVSMNGNVKRLLKQRADVEYLVGMDPLSIVSESDMNATRWRVDEDKTLLRMFYNDMGLHAIKRQLSRSYTAVRQRIRTLTLPEQVLLGREFEEYVLDLFRVHQGEEFRLKEWRGDKSIGDTTPENNHYPDFILEYRLGELRCELAVECKWRKAFSKNREVEILSQTNVIAYPQFAAERGIPVFVILGIGGQPWEPDELYILPLDKVTRPWLHANYLLPFRRLNPTAPFAFEPMRAELV